jgi:hypothetical protein
MQLLTQSAEYKWVTEVYAKQFAKRSGLSYANHVMEGAVILRGRGASDDIIKAFLIHPYYQDGAVFKTPLTATKFSPEAVALAVEYRWVANNSTSRVYAETGRITLAECDAVNEMLIADKVQNRKDFLARNQTHPNFVLLNNYFNAWLLALKIGDAEYNHYCVLMASV